MLRTAERLGPTWMILAASSFVTQTMDNLRSFGFLDHPDQKPSMTFILGMSALNLHLCQNILRHGRGVQDAGAFSCLHNHPQVEGRGHYSSARFDQIEP